jgi:hypothetical protein
MLIKYTQRRRSKKYSREDYIANREKILTYQKKWKKEHATEINEYRRRRRDEKRKLVLMTSASSEDIERNVILCLEGKELDMPLKKLGPVFKQRVIVSRRLIPREPIYKPCKFCKNSFSTIKLNKLYCSNICRKKYFKKNFYQRYLKAFYKRHRKRMATDNDYAIKTRLRDRLRESIRFFRKTGKTRKAEEYMDYEAIIKRLGPCPGNRRDYHIDHITPLYSFDFSKDEEIKRAFAPENLQWLSIKEHYKKHLTCRNF